MFDEIKNQSPKISVTEKRPLTEGMRNRPEVARVPKRLLWAVIVIAVVVVLGALFLFIRSQQQLKSVQKDLESVQNDPAAKTKESNKQLVEQVGKLIILPTDEEPTIATVSDLSKLEGQPFFEKAEVGDKVLIYQKDKKAILFRPSTNKIIELAPLNNSGSAGTPATSTPATSPAPVPAPAAAPAQ